MEPLIELFKSLPQWLRVLAVAVLSQFAIVSLMIIGHLLFRKPASVTISSTTLSTPVDSTTENLMGTAPTHIKLHQWRQVQDDESEYPRYRALIENTSTATWALTEFRMRVLEYNPYMGVAEPVVVKNLARVLIDLPQMTGEFNTQINESIVFPPGATGSVELLFRIRLDSGSYAPPQRIAKYKLQLYLVNSGGRELDMGVLNL